MSGISQESRSTLVTDELSKVMELVRGLSRRHDGKLQFDGKLRVMMDARSLDDVLKIDMIPQAPAPAYYTTSSERRHRAMALVAASPRSSTIRRRIPARLRTQQRCVSARGREI